MRVFSRSAFVAASGLAAASILAATPAARAGQPAAPPAPAPTAADWRALDPENTLVIETTKGRIVVEMRPDVAPEAVERIKTLTRRGLYDGRSFFRVIGDFMAQTGDPKDDGTGGSDLPDLPGKFNFRRGPETSFTAQQSQSGFETGFVGTMPVTSQASGLMLMTTDGKVTAVPRFCPGVGGMARATDPDTANSQFFLMRQMNANLEAKYSAWGRVVTGLDVVRAIAVGEPPVNPDHMTRARIAADIPAAERPNIRVLDTASAAFKAQVDATRIARGADFTICDVQVPVQGG